MHVLLVRHGQSKNNVLEAAHGASARFDAVRVVDPPLSPLGERQAALLGRHLGAQLYESRQRVQLMCSSMTRAIQTTQPLAGALGLRPLVLPEVHEVQGFYDTSGRDVCGMGSAEIEARFPDFSAARIPKAGQGREDPRGALRRARDFAASLRERAASGGATSEEVLVIVSHNDFIGLLARALLMPSSTAAMEEKVASFGDLFAESYWPMNNTGVSHIILGVCPRHKESYPADSWIVYWNRSDHLAECNRSGVQFKNTGYCSGAEWARVGEGGSGMQPKFNERKTVHAFSPPTWAMVAAVGVAAIFLLRRS